MMKIANQSMSHRVVITLNNVKQKSPILRPIAMAAVAKRRICENLSRSLSLVLLKFVDFMDLYLSLYDA